MDYFNNNDVDFLNLVFESFAEDNLSPRSGQNYKDVVSDFLELSVLNRVIRDDYNAMFQPDHFLRINRKSNVRPAMLKFLEALKHEGLIKDGIDYLVAKDNIESSFAGIEKYENNEKIFLSPNELKILFSDQIVYKTEEEKILLPVLCSLSFFCMMKQGEVNKLTLSDVDMENKRIRNLKSNEKDSELVKWIRIEETTYNNLLNYLSFRQSLNVDIDNFIIGADGSPLDNKKVGNLFYCFRRSENKHLLNDTSISQELLIRSMMLYILTSTNGQGVYQLLLSQETSSEQFKAAFYSYVSLFRQKNKSDEVASFSFADIIPKQLPTYVEKNIELDTGEYSEDNDINGADLAMYDEDNINPRNLDETKVTIQRLVRNSLITLKLKEKYNHECQLCGYRIRKSNGSFYSEGHHIKPYNKLHRGDDNTKNIIILCPNCHTQFDDFYFAIHPETQLVHCILGSEDDYHLTSLRMVESHVLGEEYLEYTWKLFNDRKLDLEI